MVWTHFNNEQKENSKVFEHQSERKPPKTAMKINMGTTS
jgi:hypothetical protein